MRKTMNRILDFCSMHQRLVILGAVAIAVLFPNVVTNRYYVRIATVCLLNCMLCLSFNLLSGFLGHMNLGHAAFYGIGAYTYTILSVRLQMPAYVTFLLAMVVPGFIGYLLSLVTLRLKGFYFTICTIGFGEIVKIINYNWNGLTRGALGFMNIPAPTFFGITFDNNYKNYYLALVLLCVLTFVVASILKSRLGREIVAIKEDEIAAKSIGIPTFRIKLMTFVLSSAIAGLIGAFYAGYINFIDPTNFTFNQTSLMIIMTLFGGMGSLPGGFVGAIALTLLPEVLRSLMEYRMLIYGVLMLLIVTLRPSGLLGDINFTYRRQQLLFNRKENL